ncbi:MAG: PAS domain-containing sensor histidine kinase [Brevundimonas sp.]|nr:MAG: PAS domain-containing sensor histidine kinase [Brevundimonas sp.]
MRAPRPAAPSACCRSPSRRRIWSAASRASCPRDRRGMIVAPGLFELIRDSVVAWDDQGVIRAWNPAAVALYGWTTEQAIGARVEGLLGPVPSDRDAAVIERRTADGRLLLIEASWSTGSGETLEIGRDVTAQRTVEDRLKRSELRYSSLFQAMAAAFWELDFAPVGELLRELRAQGVADIPRHFRAHPELIREMMRRTRVVDVNDTTLTMFRIGDRDQLAPSVEPYWPEASSGVYAASVGAAIGHRSHYMAETRLRRQDGTEFDALFTAAFPHEGLAQGALLVGVIDISERLSAQADLRRVRDEFAHAARVSMLGEMAASIAHEVNQPLAAISTNAAASLRWLARDEPDLQRALDLTSRIGADAQRAADVIARVRGMASKQRAAHDAVAVRAVIDETLLFLRDELQRREAKVDVVAGALTVHGDRTQLQQVLVNLIMNAVQAAAPGRRPRVWITATRDQDDVEITVADNGPGLTVEPDSLFTSFYSTKPDGMGLGLPICRSIVESHGGRIHASNGATGGAVFMIRLPVEGAHTKV